MSVRKRLSKTANVSLVSSMLGLLMLLIVGTYYGRDALHLLALDKIQSFQQLTSYAQSERSFALIRSDNVVNTEIYVTVDELFGEKNYYGYIAQLEDKYFLFFSSNRDDTSSGNMILSKWWSQSESMNVFRQMVVDDLTKSSDFTQEEVNELVFSKVFLNIDDIIISSLAFSLIWGFLLFIMLILFYKSLALKLGIFSDKVESAVLDYDLGYLNVLYFNQQWTIGEQHFIYHNKTIKILNISDIREVHFFENRMMIYFENYRTTIFASQGQMNQWLESWKIQRRYHDEPVNQL
ncbi:MAG: hypothetical protein CVU96_04195 [Firmicutes bacterium HGW-Firmicutes-20]|nr:MAG: hypothetical protein CVU96_04195 [Firmicutes bacterium HGW-Firmicutes-20]PKM65532.1 MAG: hypothetical protein CVU94_08405 [Firmicutes bacterium HGW-Firmicutes-19]